jgi:hypothetical protein
MSVVLVPRVDREHQVAVGQHSWWVFQQDDLIFVFHECPNGHVCTLRHVHSGRGHTINDNGSVQPSVVCVYPVDGVNACTFHEFIRLDGWDPSLTPKP